MQFITKAINSFVKCVFLPFLIHLEPPIITFLIIKFINFFLIPSTYIFILNSHYLPATVEVFFLKIYFYFTIIVIAKTIILLFK